MHLCTIIILLTKIVFVFLCVTSETKNSPVSRTNALLVGSLITIGDVSVT